jgi:hypothetical protein
LYITAFSKGKLAEGCEGKILNAFEYPGATDNHFSKEEVKQFDALLQMIDKKKKLVQTIRKKRMERSG